MQLIRAMTCCSLLFAAGCESNAPSTGLEISEAVVRLPLPGQNMTVGYWLLENASPKPITITQVSSPAFASVAMHRSTLIDGIAKMRPLTTVTIPPQDQIRFSAGGHHLMLIEPQRELVSGEPITLVVVQADGSTSKATATVAKQP